MSKYYFEYNEAFKAYDLMERDAIDSSDGDKLDSVIATVYDLKGLMDYIKAGSKWDKAMSLIQDLSDCK